MAIAQTFGHVDAGQVKAALAVAKSIKDFIAAYQGDLFKYAYLLIKDFIAAYQGDLYKYA